MININKWFEDGQKAPKSKFNYWLPNWIERHKKRLSSNQFLKEQELINEANRLANNIN